MSLVWSFSPAHLRLLRSVLLRWVSTHTKKASPKISFQRTKNRAAELKRYTLFLTEIFNP